MHVENYKNINNSFDKVAICHVGIDAGFFSEYSSMVEMMMYCLEHRIQFKLYSKDANFGYKNGWADYFEPFCEEVTDTFHHYCNFHSRQSWLRIWRSRKMIEAPTVKWKIKLECLSLYGFIKRILRGDFDYYTQDLSDRFGVKARSFFFSDHSFSGNYPEAFRLIDSITWHFNESVQKEIDDLISQLALPSNYISCQVRGGDKIIEFELHSVDAYIKKLKEVSSAKDVFVLTDDYKILEELREKASNYNWYSFCKPSEKGYYNRAFAKISSQEKRTQMIRFFASIELLRRSDLFLGTFTSGPSVYIANLKWPNVHFVDLDTADYFEAIDGKFAGCKRTEK